MKGEVRCRGRRGEMKSQLNNPGREGETGTGSYSKKKYISHREGNLARVP